MVRRIERHHFILYSFHAALLAQHDYLRAILTPREHRKKISDENSSFNWVHSTLRDQRTSLIPLIYSLIHVTIFPPMAKLLQISI